MSGWTHEGPLSPEAERLQVDLRRLEWTKQLSDETLRAVANTADYVEFAAGQVVIEEESEITHAYLLITGRMQAALYDVLGKQIQTDTFVRGAAIGLFALGLPDRSYLFVQATEPSTALRLTLADLLHLTARYPEFQLAVFRLVAGIFKRYVMVDRSLPKPSVVGLVHYSKETRPLTIRLARRLQELHESPCIAGDDQQWKPDEDIPFKLFATSGAAHERQDVLKDWAAGRRILVDLGADHSTDELMRFLSYVDIALWCVRPQDIAAAVPVLRTLVSRWRDKIRIVWLLDNQTLMPPAVPELPDLAQRDFKISFDSPGTNQGRLSARGIERIIHHLRGVRIGLALGGGAARGMAHLGVLKALEEQNIYPDLLAGTSAGAMVGIIYAAGLDPDYLIRVFKTELRLSWPFRHLPGGGYWYLLYKYRFNQFDSMLRKYLSRARMEQLIVPVFSISVDLVDGDLVVRETGDATTNVLESINLPPLSNPIVQSGHAFVDGGLLNNVPANVLVAKGCNFIIASTVTAKLEKDFAGIRSRHARTEPGRFSAIQVIMRQNMIQNYKMNDVGVQAADFVIAPDVTPFDISEFTRADEMAVIGETTTNESIAGLQKMLTKLDPELFRNTAHVVHDGEKSGGWLSPGNCRAAMNSDPFPSPDGAIGPI